ncbi:MAG: four helix bundle protein [Nitrospirae bacterium]|nr:four helix bundle protein [Nitrospirota bacterium]
MNYKNLIIWQKSDRFAIEVYKVTKKFPKDEIYGITSQLRRAALSIPTNIVEGNARNGDKELARFVSIAIGSMAEAEYLLDFSRRLGYLSEKEYEGIEAIRREAGKLLWNFYKKVSL